MLSMFQTTVAAKSIGSDIHFVFEKFAASVVVMLIHISRFIDVTVELVNLHILK